MRYLVFLLLLVPSLASAKVFICVDEATGKTSFTDRGCVSSASREEVRVAPANTFSGNRVDADKKNKTREKTWLSDRDNRKSGRDYQQQRQRHNDSLPTASIDTGGSYGGI